MECLLVRVFVFYILICLFEGYLFADDCSTPNGEKGLCIPIRDCRPLLEILRSKPLNQEKVIFLRASQCGTIADNPKVCCPTGRQNDPGIITRENSTEMKLLKHSLLPQDCGIDNQDRIVGGEVTDIDEFPWIALLEYQKPTGITTACGGVLINKRYVLTAAHCVKGKDLPKSWSLSRIRLGEYDTSKDLDCIIRANDHICADQVISIPIEEEIVHEGYIPHSKNQVNDIALLRLGSDVNFSDFIRPICLPQDGSIGQLLDVAGWGKTEVRSESNIKLKVRLPFVDNEACNEIYKQAGINLEIGQICAGGQKSRDSCRGDSGGPLMSRLTTVLDSEKRSRWVSVGIVSFGPSPCGMQNWPGVYTKTYEYLPWILRNMRE